MGNKEKERLLRRRQRMKRRKNINDELLSLPVFNASEGPGSAWPLPSWVRNLHGRNQACQRRRRRSWQKSLL
jgi:hypothetical protein